MKFFCKIYQPTWELADLEVPVHRGAVQGRPPRVPERAGGPCRLPRFHLFIDGLIRKFSKNFISTFITSSCWGDESQMQAIVAER